MRDEMIIIPVVALILLFLVPISFYYLGTVGGVSASSMSNDLVYLGGFLLVLFIAFFAVFGRRR